MTVLDTDLLLYSALNRPEDDTSTGGGGIDLDTRPEFTQLAAADTLEILSSAAGDTTQTVTVTGRNNAGAEISDTKTLNGTNVVAMTGTFARVLKVVLSADGAGTVTLRRGGAGATVCTIPPGERGVSATFIKSASEASPTTRYAKIFWRNANGTDTLNDAKVQLTADPAAKIRIGVHTAKGDTATITNRKTAPGGITFVDDGVQQNVPTGILAAGEHISVWAEQQLAADNAPINSTYSVELAGTSA